MGNLVSRKLPNALITNPDIALKNVISMLKQKSIISYSGKKIPCSIDTICLHGDGKTALEIAKKLRTGLLNSNIKLKKLTEIVKT